MKKLDELKASYAALGAEIEKLENGMAEIETVEIPNRNYRMGKYQITQEQWEAVMGTNPSYFKGEKNLPVESVSFIDIQQFLTKLNEAVKHKGIKYRLPTEDEWEYCAKADENFEYSGSNSVDEVAWVYSNSDRKTHPVGMKKPNAWGLHDMSGNVWEWTAS